MKFFSCLFIVLVSVGCSREPKSQELLIVCRPPVELASKVDLEIFGSFRPGLRFDSATDQFGEPEHIWTGANRTTYHLYKSLRANVAIAREIQVSGGIGGDLPQVEWWTLYAFPLAGSKTFPPEKLFSNDVCEKIAANSVPTLLVIQDSLGEEGVWCRIEKGGVTEVRWMNLASKERSSRGK